MLRRSLFQLALLGSQLVGAIAAHAGLPVELEVAVVQAAPLGAMQQWGKLLSEMDLARLRLRGAHHGDKPSITPVGAAGATRFRVVGILNHRDQLILAGGAFGQGDAARLKQFFASLPQQTAEPSVERGIFNLTRPQFEQIYGDLSRVVAESTKAVPLSTAMAAMTTELSVPLEIDPSVNSAISSAKPISIELKGLTRGTALAIALHPAGLALIPAQTPGTPLVLRIKPIEPQEESWPTGWKPDATPMKLAPRMYRVTPIEISGLTLAQALDGLAPHTGIPLIYDQRMLAIRAIDPAKVQVKFPNRKTTVRRAVNAILMQGRLSGDLRVDEAGRPFYWITSFGPDNPQLPPRDYPRADASSTRGQSPNTSPSKPAPAPR